MASALSFRDALADIHAAGFASKLAKLLSHRAVKMAVTEPPERSEIKGWRHLLWEDLGGDASAGGQKNEHDRGGAVEVLRWSGRARQPMAQFGEHEERRSSQRCSTFAGYADFAAQH